MPNNGTSGSDERKAFFYAKKEGLVVTFINTSEPKENITKVEWDFGNGKETIDSKKELFEEVQHSYNEEKLYTVTLEVTWAPGKKDDIEKYSRRVNVINIPHEEKNISLDGDCNTKQGDWIVIVKPHKENAIICRTKDATHKSITAFGISGKSTEISLDLTDRWIHGEHEEHPDKYDVIRKTTIYCEPEELELAGEPIEDDITGDEKDGIQLDDFYESLETARLVIVSGQSKEKVEHSIPATLSSVEHKTDDGKQITSIKLAEELPCTLTRNTVKIYGNVVKANHGETRREILGSGDGSKASQTFTLKQKPLSYTAAPTPNGVESTLNVFVNDVRWHETEILADRQPTDRNFITKSNDEDVTSVRFGDGKKGARLPTGIENVKAEYRSGIGKAGNVRPGQLSNLMDRPLGVREVTNPLRASGGANKDGRDQARKNVPMMVKVLDRLVSVQDYEDFARAYAGIGKAKAVELSNGRRQVVHITIAGADDTPIDSTSDLFLNLRQSLNKFGDPQQQVVLELRELLYIALHAKVRILPDYQWEPVQRQLRSTLLDTFSFAQQELGEDVLLSQVFSVMQAVPGVAYVDVDFLDGIPENVPSNNDMENNPGGTHRALTREEIVRYSTPGNESKPNQRLTVELGRFEEDKLKLRPAQIAFLAPNIPELLVLKQIK